MLSTMWSLTVPRITFKWSPQTFRSFSLSCVNRQAESEGRRPSRVFYQTLKTYPELFESYAAAGHRVTKELWAKMRAEPELFRARQEEIRYYNDRQRATSLEYRAKHRKQASAYYQAHKRDETYIRSKAMFIWCFCMIDRSKSTWARENLPWKTHIPVQQHEKTYHFCTCCGISRHLKSAVSISPSHHGRVLLKQTKNPLTTCLISGNQRRLRPSSFVKSITQRAAGVQQCPRAMKMSGRSEVFAHATRN